MPIEVAGLTKQVTNKQGETIVESSARKGKAGSDFLSLPSHDIGDPTTWYQNSVIVTDETLVDSGDGLTFNSANPKWINIYSDKLAYSHKLVPDPNAPTGFRPHSYWGITIKVNGVVTTTGFTINYTDGKVTFDSSQSGKTILATYPHINGATNPSQWLLAPPPTMQLAIEHVECQFSVTVGAFPTPIKMEVWAGGTISDYSDFSSGLYDAGYGQFRTEYKSLRQLITIGNEGKGTIPACGGLTEDIVVFPFFYVQSIVLKASQGSLLRLVLNDHTPFPNVEMANVTFYCITELE